LSFGFLVVALVAGGLTSSDRLADPKTPEPAAQAPALDSKLDDAVRRLFDSAAELRDDVRHAADGLTPVEIVDDVWVTHYGDSFAGQTLGCGGTYASDDGGIVAVGAERDAEWPCGTVLRVCGPGGCLVGERSDGCGGCSAYHVDVSEEGLYLVCGPGSGVCQASVEAFAPGCQVLKGAPVSQVGGTREPAALWLMAKLAQTALEDRTANLLDITSGAPVAPAVCTVQVR